jgi:glutamate-1-semialdehyde 2,1-aminomutase
VTALGPALAALERRYRERTPRSADAFASACAVLPGGNTRSNLHLDPYPVVLVHAEAGVLVDVDGNEYDDFNNDYTVAVLGHSHPRIAAAVHAQLSRGMSWGGRCAAESELAAEIIRRFPAIERLRFVNSGTEANVLALMTAFDATGRDRALVVDGGYHGSVFSFVARRPRINLPVSTVTVPLNDIDALEAAFSAHGSSLAAAFTELMLNSGGCIPARQEWIDRLRALCSEYGVMLVVDEVMTARLDERGLQGRFGVVPDIVTLGKILGGGFPIGAFGGSADLMAMYDVRREGAAAHGGSFNNEVFSMHAGVVALTELLTGPALTAMNSAGDVLRHRINEVFRRLDVPLVMSGIGSAMALHVGVEAPDRFMPDARAVQVRRLFHLGLLVEGLWLASRGMIATSLATTTAQVDRLVDAIEEWSRVYGTIVRNHVLDGGEVGR